MTFVLAGAIPLLPYVVVGNSRNVFAYRVLATALALFAVGALRTLITKRLVVIAGLEMVAVGGAIAILAYLVGYWINRLTTEAG